jgi:GAF domain-containing protein
VLELEQDVYRLIDPIQLVQRAADQVVDMVDGARGALVGTADGAGDVLYFCGSGIYRSWVGLKIAGQGSISGLCVRENRILVSEETATDDRVDAEACRRVNARSIVCLPVRRGPDCIGVVNVSSTQPHAFSDEDVALLSQVADFVSAVVMASARRPK